jgi:hypothetical protein
MSPVALRNIQKQHLEAMALCDRAIAARARQDGDGAARSFREAFELERRAAEAVAAEHGLEPTRSVLHRSAAAMALECGEVRVAEKLVAAALAGDPPEEVAEELRDILEQVTFQRHLELRGLELSFDEMQLSIEGKATGHGMAQSDEFVDRVRTTEKLIYRTIERKLRKPFRETGKAIKEITQNFELYLSVPRAASFAVTLRVGLPQKQMNLPIDQEILREPANIIDDLLECLETHDKKDEARLRELIPDDTYRRNFVALADQLGPDGEQIRVVGLTVSRQGEERRVALVRRQPEERAAPRVSGPEVVEAMGELRFASAPKTKKKRIRVVDANDVEHTFVVPEGMMADIVKPLWEETVIASGVRHGQDICLQHITKASV